LTTQGEFGPRELLGARGEVDPWIGEDPLFPFFYIKEGVKVDP
jgi:hypothetical protein